MLLSFIWWPFLIYFGVKKQHSIQADWKICIVYATVNVWTEMLFERSSLFYTIKDRQWKVSVQTWTAYEKESFLPFLCPFFLHFKEDEIFLNTEIAKKSWFFSTLTGPILLSLSIALDKYTCCVSFIKYSFKSQMDGISKICKRYSSLFVFPYSATYINCL